MTPRPDDHDAPQQSTPSSDPLLALVQAGVRTFDLGRPLFIGMPQSPNHPAYWHSLPRRHGDMVRPDGGSAANDVIITGTHVGTHIDAISHVSQDGRLFGGVDANQAQVGGRFDELGIHTVTPHLGRGVLLDLEAVVAGGIAPDHEVTPDELEAAVDRQHLELRDGDVVLLRTGWGRHFEDGAPFVGRDTGTPGVGAAGASWLAERAPFAVGGETIAFERTAPGAGHAVLPAHRILLVEHGIHVIETMDLEALATAGVHEFLFVLVPLPLVGATGSPVRPLAVVADG
ncbi:cyclase family protein [Salsipaludibacter albus]|uniref:cyclase family protein n=1 Tax=Salsipaludibacter albus TaxID=2849650 RepID=UPI001EE46AE2|nr:cyclase family protein [Salsipaludibacter albus]MBY5162117.1 cyclase family protein [Salsipaludibacter albus]